MRALLLALALPAIPAAADPLPAVAAALDAAIADQRLLATCLGLDPDSHAILAERWGREVEEAAAALAAGGYDAAAVARFRDRADPAALAPGPEETYLAVRDLCWDRSEEVSALRMRLSRTFRVSSLPDSLPSPFGQGE